MIPRTPTSAANRHRNSTAAFPATSSNQVPITPKITRPPPHRQNNATSSHRHSQHQLLQLKQKMKQLDQVILSKQQQIDNEYKSLLDEQIRQKKNLQNQYEEMYHEDDSIFSHASLSKKKYSVSTTANRKSSLSQHEQQNWFGKPGAGAPLVDTQGNVKANLKNWDSPKQKKRKRRKRKKFTAIPEKQNKKRNSPSMLPKKTLDTILSAHSDHSDNVLDPFLDDFEDQDVVDPSDDLDLASPINHSSRSCSELDDDDDEEELPVDSPSAKSSPSSTCSTPLRDEDEIRDLLKRNHEESVSRAMAASSRTKQHDAAPVGQHSQRRSSFLDNLGTHETAAQEEKIERQLKFQQDLHRQIEMKQERLKREKEEEEARLPSYVRSSVSPSGPPDWQSSQVRNSKESIPVDMSYDDTPIGSHFVRRRGRRSLSPTRRSREGINATATKPSDEFTSPPPRLSSPSRASFQRSSTLQSSGTPEMGSPPKSVYRSPQHRDEKKKTFLPKNATPPAPVPPPHQPTRKHHPRVQRRLQDDFSPPPKDTSAKPPVQHKRTLSRSPPRSRNIGISSQATLERRRRGRIQREQSSSTLRLPPIMPSNEPTIGNSSKSKRNKRSKRMRRSQEDYSLGAAAARRNKRDRSRSSTLANKRHSVANPEDVPAQWESDISSLREEIGAEQDMLSKKIHGLLNSMHSNGVDAPTLLSQDFNHSRPRKSDDEASPETNVRRRSALGGNSRRQSIASREKNSATTLGIRRPSRHEDPSGREATNRILSPHAPAKPRRIAGGRPKRRLSKQVVKRVPGGSTKKPNLAQNMHHSLRSYSKFVYDNDDEKQELIIDESSEFVMPTWEDDV